MRITVSSVIVSICLLFGGMSLLPAHVAAQEQTDRAWLRIETGTHTAQLLDAATDAAGRVLVTVNYDKTGRVWSLPELRPLGVLRPPIGPGNEGKLYAVAVSPDGKAAAVGGYTGPDSGPFNVYVFDLATKAIVRRLTGLPGVVHSLAFGLDGRLAAGLGGSNGIRVWHDRRIAFEDRAYGSNAYGLTFAVGGRLATASWDGKLRLYDAKGTLLRTQSTEAGKHPLHIRFSPNGARLAVGFDDVAALEVRDGTTLALQSRFNVTGLDDSWLGKVAWTTDGRMVFAGGDVWDGASKPVFAWDLATGGKRRTAAAGFTDGIGAIAALPNGSLAIASSSGEVAVAARDGSRLHEVRPSGQDLRHPANNPASPYWRLRLSGDGRRVEWVTFPSPDRLLLFDPSAPDLSVGKPAATDLIDWTDHDDTLRVTGWDSRADPKLNGYPLQLDQNELAHSASVANHRVLLGTSWWLRMLDASGGPTWPQPVPVPGAAWRVNQSQDGRLAVAALYDSTIRWYRSDNGQELLALMVTEDAQRWVAFTPSGYYAAGPDSEDLIGWHVNRGADQAADFFPAGRFRDKFYRPDVVKRVLDTLDEAAAVRQADAALGTTAVRNKPSTTNPLQDVLRDRPPVATIIAPRDGTTLASPQVYVQVQIRSPTGRPITRVEARIDGRPAPDASVGPAEPLAAPAPERAERRTITMTLTPNQNATIQVIAWSDDRASEAATLHLLGPPPVQAPQNPDLTKPRLNAVLVGISAYQSRELRLKFAAKDASDLAAALRRQQDGLYREINIHLVPEATATRDTILTEILWLRRQTTQRDLAILFLAGHGVAEDVEYYFLTVDADPDAPSIRGLPGTELRTQLRQIPGRTVALLDTCYAGAMIQGQHTRDLPLDISKLVAELSAAETGVAVYSATTNRQRAAELEALNNGVFTSALLDVLTGRYGPKGPNLIRVNYLATLLGERVKTLSQGRQASTYNALDPIRDIPLFVVR